MSERSAVDVLMDPPTMLPKGGEAPEPPAGANGPAGPSLPVGKVELPPEARRMLEGRAGRLRDYAKAAIDAGDWAAAFESIGKIANIENELGGGLAERDRLGEVERVLAALVAGARKDGAHPHLAAVLEGQPIRFTFGRNAAGGLAVDFAPLKAGRQ